MGIQKFFPRRENTKIYISVNTATRINPFIDGMSFLSTHAQEINISICCTKDRWLEHSVVPLTSCPIMGMVG